MHKRNSFPNIYHNYVKKYKIIQRLSAAAREELPLALVLQALASAVFVSIFLLLCLFKSICRFLLLCQVFFFFSDLDVSIWKGLSFHYICSIIGSSQEAQFFYHNYLISVTVETCGATVTENNTWVKVFLQIIFASGHSWPITEQW